MIGKLDLYKVFRQVGKSGSFSKAAEELYMSQPAISQSINQLEKELEVRLFNRNRKGVNFTKEGEELFYYINSAINIINVGEEKVLEFKNLSKGELKIGVGDTITKYYLIPFLEKFHSRYPNIKLKIINRTTIELCSSVKNGELDIAICNFPIKDSSLELIPLIEVEDIFVCGEKYSYLLEGKVSFKELLDLPLIFLEKTSNSRNYVESFIRSKGFEISPDFELGSYDLLLEFAKINLGVSCIIKEFSKDSLEKKELYEIEMDEKIPKRNIGVCYSKKVPLSLGALEFLKIMKE